MSERKHHCFNCGEYVGEFNSFGDLVSCNKAECEKALGYQDACERDRRREDAAEDDYARY